jgi:uncharacterized protein (TIGR04255 family)
MAKDAKQLNTVQLPDYERPPVIEVVCGITFKPLEQLLAPYFGVYWEKIKEQYSFCVEKGPLPPVIEGPLRRKSFEVEVFDVPPIPRIWFINQDSNELIQLQRDRFLHNWRKKDDESKYPKYKSVISEFESQLGTFSSFVSENNLGKIEPLQYELTYVNHIPQGECWSSAADLGQLVVAANDRVCNGKFLQEVEGFDLTATFALPNECGRLYVNLQTAVRAEDQEKKLLQLNLTARGIGEFQRISEMRAWFDIAHESIVRGFADLTTERAQNEIWRRK